MDENDPIVVAWRQRQKDLQTEYNDLNEVLQAVKNEEDRRLFLTRMGEIRREQYARPPHADWFRAEECKIGLTYAIYSRNLTFGVFTSGSDGGFVGIREKFGSEFLFTEYHRDLGGMVGTVEPWLRIEQCPVEDLREHWDAGCKLHGRPTLYDETKPRARDDGFVYPGTWVHADDGTALDLETDSSTLKGNSELFDYLKDVEDRFQWRTIMNLTRNKNNIKFQYRQSVDG